jgi:predicted site-specific integrase-resolvase
MAELMDLREGAKEMHISIHTARAWCNQRKLPFVKLGRRVFLRRGDIESFINKNVVKAK